MSTFGLVAAVLCAAGVAAVVVFSVVDAVSRRGHSMEGDR